MGARWLEIGVDSRLSGVPSRLEIAFRSWVGRTGLFVHYMDVAVLLKFQGEGEAFP